MLLQDSVTNFDRDAFDADIRSCYKKSSRAVVRHQLDKKYIRRVSSHRLFVCRFRDSCSLRTNTLFVEHPEYYPDRRVCWYGRRNGRWVLVKARDPQGK